VQSHDVVKHLKFHTTGKISDVILLTQCISPAGLCIAVAKLQFALSNHFKCFHTA
jgi:hypothetical protein